MSNASPTVFIAYARADTAHVEPIAAMLRQRGYSVFFDPASVHGAGDYVRQSQRALAEADALIVCWTRAAARSPWIESEARAFQSQLARGGARRLIPVWLDATPLPTALASYDAVDGSSATPASIADMLAQSLGAASPAPSPAPMPAASLQPAAPTSARAEATGEAGQGVPLLEPSVFIAFARSDQARVEAIAARLRDDGYHVIFDATGAHGRGDYVQTSQQALNDATTLVVCWSKAAAQSPWVASEMRVFLARSVRGDYIQVVLARLDDAPMPPQIAHYPIVEGALMSPDTLGDEVASAISGSSALADVMPAAGASAPDWDFDEVRSAEGDLADASAPSPQGWADGEEAAAPSSSGASWGSPLDDTLTRAPVPESEGPGRAPAPEVLHDSVPIPPFAAPPPPPIVAPPAPPIYTPPPVAAPAPGAPPSYGGPQPAPQPITQPRGKGVVAGESADALPGSLEQVTFTAYHPREIQAQQWQPMLVFISLDTAAAMAQVAGSAAERLGGKLDQYRPGRSAQSAALRRGAKLRIIPSAPGFQFNPDYLDITWQEDAQQHEFRMRAESAQPGQAVNGVVQFYQGLTLRGEVPISVFVGQAVARLDSPDAYKQAIARAYRHIFASYSHQDTPVVESCESAAHLMGDQYLRDVTLLQSGQEWDPRLIQAINDADVFQLFWSRRAATSPFVEREWRHALMLLPTRPNFIRPVYWSRQLYPAPAELNPLHFQPLSLSSLGWSKLRAAWYNMRNG